MFGFGTIIIMYATTYQRKKNDSLHAVDAGKSWVLVTFQMISLLNKHSEYTLRWINNANNNIITFFEIANKKTCGLV